MDDTATHGERVKASILTTGLNLWRNGERVTARAIGRALNMTHSAVLYHFGGADGLHDAVARHAVSVGDAIVVPQLIVAKHAAAAALGDGERRRYLAGC